MSSRRSTATRLTIALAHDPTAVQVYEPETKPSQLAGVLGMTTGSAYSMLRRLEQQGW